MKVTIDEKKGELTIVAKLSNPPEPSGSGKTLLVASTRGSLATDQTVNGKQLIVNLNAYIYAGDKPSKAAK